MSSPRLDRRAPTRPPHPLRQSQTIDYSAVARQLSNASSSASSGYSNASSGLFTYAGPGSTVSSSSSPTSTYSVDQRQLHRRGQSEASRPSLKSSQSAPAPAQSTHMSAENVYNAARQSLRPLPSQPGTAPSIPAKTSPGRHDRGQSVDIGTLNFGRLSIAGYDGSPSSSSAPPPPPPPPLRSRASTVRPTSMLLTRSDSLSVRRSVEPGPSTTSPPALAHAQAAPITTPELERLGRSSTNQLRTLSQLAQSPDADQFALATTAQDVVGLRGRRRLQRRTGKKPGQRNGYGWEGRDWMEKQRQFLQAYEYLCHIGEAKEWIEDIIHKPIPAIVELEEALRDGVTLAEVVEALNPARRFRIFHHPRLQYRHSDNIAIFFRYLDEVELPDLFRFELIDLYEKKNIPKVIYCIHALSWLLFRKGIVDFQIGNLVGQLDFEHHELEAMQKGLDKLGTSMPSFGNMGATFGVESPPTPEPEETEEERIDRELGENEASIVELQAQARGAVERMRIARTLQTLWDAEPWLAQLQSRIRGDWTREIINYRLGRRRFAVSLQSAARGFLVRQRQAHQEHACRRAEPRIVKLQSAIRARRIRDEVRDERSRLERVAGPVRAIQAVSRGFLMRRHVQEQARETGQEAGNVALLQAAARGFLMRRHVREQAREISQEAGSVTLLQAAARGVLVRRHVQEQARKISQEAGNVTLLQAATRGFLMRRHVQEQARETGQEAGNVALLQGAARGMMLRKEMERDLDLLHEQTPAISALQAAARAVLTRTQVERQREALRGFGPQWQAIQAGGRGNLARANLGALKAALGQHSPAVERLQACARAGAARREVAKTLEGLEASEAAFVDLQSMVRGMLQRQKASDDLDALDNENAHTTDLQAHVRGMLSRQRCERLLDNLQESEAEIAALQGLARAMLRRGEVATVLEQLDEQEEVVAAVQAAAKAFVVRAKFEDKKRHFKENMQKVVKIQSFVRAKLQGEAYKSLTTGKNPPVGAVKNFVHLLNDSDFDFNEEVEFERLRKTVVQQVRQNEMLEQYIDQLDIKIALLVKNKITLDEVVRHQSNYGGHTSSLLANSNIASTNQFDLKALNKSSRKKLELYQQLFFTLQTQPQYLARLFKRIREQGTAEKECKRVEHLMMGLFGYAQKRREEYYLLKLIGRSIHEEVDACGSAQEYLRGNMFWAKLLANYTRSPRDRKYLRDLLGPLIRDNIVEDPALDLESDPMQIYRSAINNEELRTGRPSNRPLDIPREMAIKDAETRELFIDHLRDLREICDQFLLALEDLLPRMPYGLRFVCRQNYEALCQQFKREPQHHLLQLVVTWLWRFYLHPALVAPENVGVSDRQFSPLQRRNLGEVAKVLGQIASGRPFGGDNIYLQPLNAFVGESVERLLHIAGELISVPDAENTFHIDEFNDLYAKNKPTLYIKMTDIFAIHNLVATGLGVMCPAQSTSRDDVLREIMQDLGSAKNNESEMTAAGSTDIQMFLTPKLHDLDDPEAEAKALFMETKRCILYIIRVQQGANLLEILVKPIGEEDEMRWASLLREDFRADGGKGASGRPTATRGAYSDANMIDVTRMSYHELKRTALENVMRLDRMGRISKHNYYQDILNAIALDIRSKSRRRVQRQRELEGVRLTLANLHEKAKYLEQQRKSYDDYIEQAMATLQNKKGKKRFLLPFTKQYNHQRELERSGRVPKFGSYKYSARALADKGVLVSWAGTAERDWGQMNLTISCDQVGVFSLEGSRGHIQIPGASALVPIEDLLQAQFDGLQFMTLFEGNLKLNVNLLLHRVYKKFYRTQ